MGWDLAYLTIRPGVLDQKSIVWILTIVSFSTQLSLFDEVFFSWLNYYLLAAQLDYVPRKSSFSVSGDPFDPVAGLESDV